MPEARCTSDTRNIFKSLNPKLQKIINECKSDKDFHVQITLRYENPEHKKKYDAALVIDIEKITKAYINSKN